MTWLDVGKALLGVVVGGGIALGGVYLQIRHQVRMEDRRRLRDGLERLHLALSALYDATTKLGRAVNERRPFFESLDSAKIDVGSMRMLVDFYAPELKAEAEVIEREIEEMTLKWGRWSMASLATPNEGSDAAARAQQTIKVAKRKLSKLASALRPGA